LDLGELNEVTISWVSAGARNLGLGVLDAPRTLPGTCSEAYHCINRAFVIVQIKLQRANGYNLLEILPMMYIVLFDYGN
jgi:hypothetical protein